MNTMKALSGEGKFNSAGGFHKNNWSLGATCILAVAMVAHFNTYF